MKVIKILQIGRRQMVRLPKSFRFKRHPVAIKQFGHDIQLPPIENP
jgi:antitoxin VapB